MEISIPNLEELDKRAQLGAFSTLDMEVLVPELQKLEKGDIYLEVGTDKGKSLSVAKMVVKEGVSINGVDINFTPEFKEYINQNSDIGFFWMSSATAATVWKERYGFSAQIKLLFIDGDHSYEGCKKDLLSWSDFLAPDAVLLFHDHDETSPGVIQAVAEFVNNHQEKIKEYKIFKRIDKNTSMAKVVL